jgi:hypothetical protein
VPTDAPYDSSPSSLSASALLGVPNGVNPGIFNLTFFPSFVVRSGCLGSNGSPGIGLILRGYSA